MSDYFGNVFFAPRFFGAPYYGSGDGTVTPTPEAVVARPTGGISKRRRRILLADGRIVTPANDAEYRRVVEEIVAGFQTPETGKRRRRRIAGAVVAPPKPPKTAPVQSLPGEFYTGLEFHRTGVLNYLAILSAWQAYLAEMDEDEAITLLMVN